MQFLIIAYDGTDEGALERRQTARSHHTKMTYEAMQRGEHLLETAIRNEAGQPIGSMMVVEYRSRADLDAWLAQEPYMTAQVWQSVTIEPCAVETNFFHLFRGETCS